MLKNTLLVLLIFLSACTNEKLVNTLGLLPFDKNGKLVVTSQDLQMGEKYTIHRISTLDNEVGKLGWNCTDWKTISSENRQMLDLTDMKSNPDFKKLRQLLTDSKIDRQNLIFNFDEDVFENFKALKSQIQNVCEFFDIRAIEFNLPSSISSKKAESIISFVSEMNSGKSSNSKITFYFSALVHEGRYTPRQLSFIQRLAENVSTEYYGLIVLPYIPRKDDLSKEIREELEMIAEQLKKGLSNKENKSNFKKNFKVKDIYELMGLRFYESTDESIGLTEGKMRDVIDFVKQKKFKSMQIINDDYNPSDPAVKKHLDRVNRALKEVESQ